MIDLNENLPISVTCEHCNDKHIIIVKTKDMKAWEDGALIQDVLHYLTSEQRELLIRATCSDCFDRFYPY
tara:strand:+ start:304 stop:513 length:210 start_codon:yes stop_codon:yes gene_type:complete